MAIAIERNFPIPQQAVIQELDMPEVAVDDLGKNVKLKTDAVDATRGASEKLAAAAIVTATELFISLGGVNGDLAPYFVTLATGFYFVARAGKRALAMREADQHKVTNYDLGYEAGRLVYSGEEIEVGGIKLKKGDNIYRVKFPKVVCMNREPSPAQEEAVSRLHARILEHLRKRTAQRDYQTVCIELDSDFAKRDPLFKNMPQITRGELLEGKNIMVTSSDMPIAVLSREVFDAMCFEPSEIFERAVNALEQSIGRRIDGKFLTQELKRLKFKKGEDLLTEARRLSVKLDHLVDSEGERQFNGVPDTFIDKTPEDEDCKYVLRKRLGQHPVLSVVKSLKGEFLQQIRYERGDKRTLLKLDRDLDDIIAMTIDAKGRALLLSYRISQMLKSPEFLAEIAQPTQPSTPQILQKLEELGVKRSSPGMELMGFVPKPGRLVNAAKNAFLAMALTGILVAGGRTGVEAGNGMPTIFAQQENTGIGNLPETIRPDFPELKSDLLWKIEDNTKPESNLKADGYYITSTASAYESGEWDINNSLENSVLLNNAELAKANDQDSSITITGDMILDISGSASFKLPLRDSSTLYRLNIVDANGNSLDQGSYKVYRLEDGTFEVRVSLGFAKASTFITVKEVLIWSKDSVHAIKRIPTIDVSKLDNHALELLKNNEQTQQQLAQAVGSGIYSNNPADNGVLDNLDGSPESFINAADNLNGKNCAVSNTEYALLSSVLNSQDYVNIAFGYGGSVNGNSSKYIDNVESHVFTITNNGNIIDATPSKVLTTQQSTGNTQETKGADLDTVWNQKENDLKRQADLDKAIEGLALILGLGTLGTALLLAPKGVGSLRRNLTQKKNNSFMPGELDLEGLSLEKLQEAYDILNWLCYGGRKLPTSTSPIASFQNPAEFIKRAKEGLARTPIRAYLRNPEVFERNLGITNPQALRQLARLALSE